MRHSRRTIFLVFVIQICIAIASSNLNLKLLTCNYDNANQRMLCFGSNGTVLCNHQLNTTNQMTKANISDSDKFEILLIDSNLVISSESGKIQKIHSIDGDDFLVNGIRVNSLKCWKDILDLINTHKITNSEESPVRRVMVVSENNRRKRSIFGPRQRYGDLIPFRGPIRLGGVGIKRLSRRYPPPS